MEARTRKPRSDGRRNRERVIEIARAAFIAGEENITFEELGRRAQIGAGTLYRHFPNRDLLIEAVYSAELRKLEEAADQLSATRSPLEALRAWMLLFVDYIATKKLAANAVNAAVENRASSLNSSAAAIREAVRKLASRAIDSGELDPKIDALDFLRALVGVANVSAAPDWHASARRLTNIMIAGSRKP